MTTLYFNDLYKKICKEMETHQPWQEMTLAIRHIFIKNQLSSQDSLEMEQLIKQSCQLTANLMFDYLILDMKDVIYKQMRQHMEDPLKLTKH